MKWVTTASVVLLTISGCARFQPTQPALNGSAYTPTGIEESFTMKDTAVHYDSSVLRVGASREDVSAAYGEPNETLTSKTGATEEIYAFNPDGTKFVNPELRPRNIALGVFTMGTSVAVRQARLSLTESKLTLFHVIYTPDGTIQKVTVERLRDAPQQLPTNGSATDQAIQ